MYIPQTAKAVHVAEACVPVVGLQEDPTIIIGSNFLSIAIRQKILLHQNIFNS